MLIQVDLCWSNYLGLNPEEQFLTSRKNSLELIKLSSINKVSLV